MLSWLMFVASGIGPFSGQAVHFKRYAPEPMPYAIERYNFEAWQHWNIVDAHLAKQSHMVGNSYSRVDTSLDDGYRAMAADAVREAQAQEWSNALAKDMSSEAR